MIISIHPFYNKLVFVIFLMLAAWSVSGQDSIRTVLELDFLFQYDLEEVEDAADGIVIYDQYCPGITGQVNLRKDVFNHLANKEQVDYYSNGKVLHRGVYEDGSLIKYRNYYPNDQVERELKVKKGKPKLFMSYYIFGEIRERRVFDDGFIMLHEKYHYSGRLKYLLEISDVGYLKMEQWNDEEGFPLKYTELIDEDSLIYEIAENYTSGTIKNKRHYIFDPKTETYCKHGHFESYTETGVKVADMNYEFDQLVQVLIAEKSKTETEVAANMSSIPAEYLAFDMDNNGEITKGEIDEAVNSFFDEDSTLKVSQINGLVNYFFEQDW